MRPEQAQKILGRLLFVAGCVPAMAIFAMVMPTDWMEAGNAWLGLDPFHRSPLTEYLTRSLSGLYALVGILAIYASRRIAQYADLIEFTGWLTIGFGIALNWIAVSAGLPARLAWSEGPPAILLGVAFIWLGKRAQQPPDSDADDD